MKRAAVLLAAVVVCAPFGSRAHGPSDPRVRYAVPTLVPAATKVTTQISPPVVPHLPPQVRVDNATGKDLTLLGQAGEPFLRIGPRGSFGNVRSPWLGPALNPADPAPPSRGPSPAWKLLSATPSFRWYEKRAAYAGHAPADARKAAVLQTWIVPGQLGSAPLQLTGQILWRPVLGSVVSKVLEIAPAVPKVEVRVLPGPLPAFELRNGSGRPIQITGRDGRPFGRIGPAGVEINVNSATYRDTRQLSPATTAAVQWQKQPGQTVLVWLERRAAYEGEPPASVQESGRVQDLKQWSVPGSIGTEAMVIRGVTRWEPAPRTREARKRNALAIVLPVTGLLVAIVIGAGMARARRNA